MSVERWRRLLPGLWLGWLACVALVATPSAFAVLARADAARVVSRMLAQEAYVSLLLGVVLLLLEREVARREHEAGRGSQLSTGMLLCLSALACTVLGYFAVQPMMDATRAGHGPLGFGALHAISTAFYVVKAASVGALAWRHTRPAPAA